MPTPSLHCTQRASSDKVADGARSGKRPGPPRAGPDGIAMTTEKTGAPTAVTQRRKEFTITVDGHAVGNAAFEDRGDRRIFVHTKVDDAFQGRGLATILD